ncbi:hypothetical protein EYR40_004874 [Pleurotus pulmonarius]|nr:hypothetical protein EYR38_006092 [Pleurotus pulmonarius]KAF4601675.1 hypothetical protein EYR40_004874 [Pleurotus pulmonarius]
MTQPLSVSQRVAAITVSEATIARISGNAPYCSKDICLRLLGIITEHNDLTAFAGAIGRRIQLTDVSLVENPEEPMTTESRVVCELRVTEDMVNLEGNLHGGCSVYLVDVCSALPLSAWRAGHQVAINDSDERQMGNLSGVSQSINTTFHTPAPLGTNLQVISTSMICEGALLCARCQIWDKDNHSLVASGLHLKMMPSQPKPRM